ncbi:MAG: DUF4760 domain-containing protein [Acidimicrobiia bacterium]
MVYSLAVMLMETIWRRSPDPTVVVLPSGSELTDWLPLFATVIVLLGIYIAWKSATKARHAALMADLSRRWDDPTLSDARRFMDLLGPNLQATYERWDRTQDPRAYILERVPNFFEDLSVLEQVGAIDFEMIRMSLGRSVVDVWDIWAPTIRDVRHKYGDDQEIYQHFERLKLKMERSFEKEPAPPLRVAD